MKILEEINRRLKVAMLARDTVRKDVLRFVKGKLDLMKPNLPDAEVHKILRGLLKEAAEIPTMFTQGETDEIADLTLWAVMNDVVPALMTQSEILEVIKASPETVERIKAAPDENKAMGPAMGLLKGKVVEVVDVKAVINVIRG
jgi:uncharacterized protein YqeY